MYAAAILFRTKRLEDFDPNYFSEDILPRIDLVGVINEFITSPSLIIEKAAKYLSRCFDYAWVLIFNILLRVIHQPE
jgi:hypothetical protein